MLNPGILDRMMIALNAVVNPAWPILIHDTLWLLGVVSTLYLIGMCAVVMSGGLEAIPQMYVAIAKYMGLMWALTNFPAISKTLINVHAGLGLVLSRTTMTAAEFALPGRILWQGQDMLWPLIKYVEQLGWLDYAMNAVEIWFMSGAMWVSFIGFFLFALNMALVQIRCAIAMLMNFPKLAFGLFSGTAFLAKEAIDAILQQLMALATVSFFVGLSTPWFKWLAFPDGEKPGYWSAFAFMGGVWFILVLAFAGPLAMRTHGASLISAAAGTAYGVVRGVSWLRR